MFSFFPRINLRSPQQVFFFLGIINQKYIKCKRQIDLSAIISCEIFDRTETEVYNRFLGTDSLVVIVLFFNAISVSFFE